MAAPIENKRRNYQYVGEVKNLVRHGFGLYEHPNRFIRYEGEWDNGKKHGNGKLFMKDGSYYEGEFFHGEIEGNGTRYWAKKGDSYSGQFRHGELHGYGVMLRGNRERYEGEFACGLREGHGLLVQRDGQTYRGSFHQNKRHGEGLERCSNGDEYEGGWLLDQKQGHGVMRFGDGSLYEGQWRNNLFNGQGTLMHCSGLLYEGLWMNGRPLGGASKIVIEGGDVLEVFQESPFCVEVQLLTEEGENVVGESGRLLEISAGLRLPDGGPDPKQNPLHAALGFQVVSYPLMERGFESLAAPLPPCELTVAAVPSVSTEVGATSSSVALDDSLIPKGREDEAETQAESEGETQAEAETETLDVTDSVSGMLTGTPENLTLPSNQRVENGRAKFQGLMLVPPTPEQLSGQFGEELDPKNTKKQVNRPDKQGVVSEKSTEIRQSTGSRVNLSTKKAAHNGGSGKPGELVIIVKDVTSPSYLNQTVSPAFVFVKVLPANTKNTSHRDKTRSK